MQTTTQVGWQCLCEASRLAVPCNPVQWWATCQQQFWCNADFLIVSCRLSEVNVQTDRLEGFCAGSAVGEQAQRLACIAWHAALGSSLCKALMCIFTTQNCLQVLPVPFHKWPSLHHSRRLANMLRFMLAVIGLNITSTRSLHIRHHWHAAVLCLCCVLQLGCGEGLPEAVTEELLQDDGFLQKFHHALLEVRRGPAL